VAPREGVIRQAIRHRTSNRDKLNRVEAPVGPSVAPREGVIRQAIRHRVSNRDKLSRVEVVGPSAAPREGVVRVPLVALTIGRVRIWQVNAARPATLKALEAGVIAVVDLIAVAIKRTRRATKLQQALVIARTATGQMNSCLYARTKNV